MKMLTKTILIISLSGIIILFGCKDKLVNPSKNKTFYPIEVGNTWNYNYKSYDSVGNLLYQGEIKETLSKKRMKDNFSVYQFDSPLNPPSPGAFNFTYYFQNLSDGLHFLTSSDPTGYWIYDRLLYKYPCSLNEIYVYGTRNYDTTFVVSLNDSVSCEAGTFSCIVYKNIGKIIVETYTKVLGYDYTYVAYGIGKVKYESYRIDSKNRIYKAREYSLINFKLN